MNRFPYIAVLFAAVLLVAADKKTAKAKTDPPPRRAQREEPDNRPKQLTHFDEEKPSERPYASVFLGVDRTTIQEGENLDLVFAIRNETKRRHVDLTPPRISMELRFQRIDDLRKAIKQLVGNDKPLFDPSVDHHYFGVRFDLEPGEVRLFHLTLSDHFGSGFWLEPGEYLLQAAYATRPDPNSQVAETKGEPSPDWKKTLLSGGIKLVVTPAPKEENAGVVAARSFLRSDGRDAVKRFFKSDDHDMDKLMASFSRVNKLQMKPSLEKRVHLHFVRQLFKVDRLLRRQASRQKGADQIRLQEEAKKIKSKAMNELEALARKKLTRGEAAHILTWLGDLYGQDRRWKDAEEVLKQVNTPRAQFLRKINQEETERPLRKWTNNTGNFSVEARLVELKQGKVRLKKKDGSIIAVPLSQLTKADREYIKKTLPESFPQKPTPKKPAPK